MKTTTASPKFRETLWFKKGVLDGIAAERAATSDEGLPDAADSLPIEDRYLEDGSVAPEDSASFGLHTGLTQRVAAVAASRPPSAGGPGEDELAAELVRGRGVYLALIASGLTVLVALVLTAV